jgi:hypothetical protein
MSSTTLAGAAGNASGAGKSSPATTGMQRGYVAARAVGSYVPKLTRKAFEKYGFSAATLLTDWANIVGEDTAAYTAPERLKWPRQASSGGEDGEGDSGRRQGAVLVLRVDPARALDAEYKGRQIVERINGHFGYRAISELRLLQAPLRGARSPAGSQSAPPAAPPPPCAAPELADIADDRLRAALTKLKSGLLARANAGS